MKEIKFRGKRVDNKEWMYGYYILREEKSPIIETTETYQQHLICTYDLSGLNEFEVIPETVGQFTGLKDCKGVDIWEGDKILTQRGDWGIIVYVAPYFEVTVSETQSCIYSREWFNTVEVIGNIHNK